MRIQNYKILQIFDDQNKYLTILYIDDQYIQLLHIIHAFKKVKYFYNEIKKDKEGRGGGGGQYMLMK